jgi:hypothetical protein
MARVRIEDLSGVVQGTAQVVGRGPPHEARPEEAHQLFAKLFEPRRRLKLPFLYRGRPRYSLETEATRE